MVCRGYVVAAIIALCLSWPARGQETTAPDEPSAVVDDSPAPAQGKLAIKPSEEDRPLSPWRRFPQHILSDQKAIWTSPLRINRDNAKWWIGFGAATGVLIATDKWTSKQLPNTKDQVEVAKWGSRIGASYTLVPLAGALYFTGAATNKHHLRETGLLAIEALTDTMIVTTAIKAATQRERPLEGDGRGRFWKGAGRFWNEGASFPSGHASETWALASVFAHEYGGRKLAPILTYTLAMAVNGSRFAARQHFASDVVLGAGIGWWTGHYVYHKRHDPSIDRPTKVAGWLAEHVHPQIEFSR